MSPVERNHVDRSIVNDPLKPPEAVNEAVPVPQPLGIDRLQQPGIVPLGRRIAARVRQVGSEPGSQLCERFLFIGEVGVARALPISLDIGPEKSRIFVAGPVEYLQVRTVCQGRSR